MPTIAERVAECDRLISEMDPEDAREVLLAALRERYGGIHNPLSQLNK